MTLFIQDSDWDMIMYYPIQRELDRKQLEYKTLNINESKLGISGFISTISLLKDIECAMVWGYSEKKLTAILLLKEMGIKTVLLDSHSWSLLPPSTGNKTRLAISSVSLVDNSFVPTYEKMVELKSTVGITDSSISLIESPITHLTMKCKINDENTQKKSSKMLICVSSSDAFKNDATVTGMGCAVTFMTLDDILADPIRLYTELRNSDYVVSDNFIFDTPCFEMGKRFFYIGCAENLSSYSNLGITTHVFDLQKKELRDHFITVPRSPLPIRRPDYGLQSLFKLLP